MKEKYKNLSWYSRETIPHQFPITNEEKLELADIMVEARAKIVQLENDLAVIKKNYADAALARLLAKVNWLKGPRLACDHKSQMEAVKKAVTAIRKYSGKKGTFSCYVLVKDIEDALERVEFLRDLGVDPFAQPYREPGSRKEPAKDLKHFARWVNHKAIFKSVAWEDYGIPHRRRRGFTVLANQDYVRQAGG